MLLSKLHRKSAVLALLLTVGCSDRGEWVFHHRQSRDDEAYRLYFDPASIRKTLLGKIAEKQDADKSAYEIEVLYVYDYPQFHESKPWMSSIQLLAFNCASKQYSVLGLKYFEKSDGSGKSLETIARASAKATWGLGEQLEYEDGSPLSALFTRTNGICKNR